MCNIKKIVLLSCLIVFATRATAQKLGVQYLPSPDSSTPSWALLLYNDTINANELEAAYNLYYSYNSFEKSIYTQYYKRWFMHNMAYIQPNGSVYRPQLGKVLANNTLSQWECV